MEYDFLFKPACGVEIFVSMISVRSIMKGQETDSDYLQKGAPSVTYGGELLFWNDGAVVQNFQLMGVARSLYNGCE